MRYDENKNYWFTIDPYVYAYRKMNLLLLFNTLDGSIIETNDEEVIELVEATLSEENLSVSYLEGKRFKKNIIDFIDNIREKFMGDIIDIQYSNCKPIQFITQANLLGHNIEKQAFHLFHNISQMNVKSFLDEITIVINGNLTDSEFTKQTWLCNEPFNESDNHMPLKLVKKIGESLRNTNVMTVNIIGTDITAHPDIDNIVSFFQTLPLKVEYIQNATRRKYDYITSIICDVKQLMKGNINYYENHTYLFIVETDEELFFLQNFIEDNHIENYKIIPYFTKDNLAFFEKNVYIEKEDLEYEPQKLNDIYAKRFINLNYFGKLFIATNGEIYSCLYEKPITVFKDSLKDVIIKELISEESSWRKIRSKYPCCNCIYQWLCPSPSCYENAIGKNNLCHIKP